MQPSFPKKPQPEPENNCPDCLYMKLEGILVSPDSQDGFDFWQIPTQTQQIDLHLTINFNEQWESLRKGRIKFGLKGGQLRLKLENTEAPYESRKLNGSFELSTSIARQEPKGSKEHKGREVHTHAVDPSLNGSNSKNQTKVGTEQKSGRTEPSQVNFCHITTNLCHITTKVSEENPTWIFEEEVGGYILKGSLKTAKLATLHVLALPCRVEATFEVSKRDVCLTDAEGLWPPDLSRNKRAVLDRLIVQRLLESKFKPYLSRAELRYE